MYPISPLLCGLSKIHTLCYALDMNKNLTVTKHNDLIESSYKLTLDEQRLVLLACGKIDSFNAPPETTTITAAEFGEMFGLSRQKAYEQLHTASARLYERSIKLRDNPEIDLKFREMRWIQGRAEYKNGTVELEWSNRVRNYLGCLTNHLTSYKLESISGLKSVYSIRIFEMMMKFDKTGVRTMSLDQFREQLGIGEKHKRFADLNKNVIKPALAELKTKSKFVIRVEPIKKGQKGTKVVALKFFFKPNPQLSLDLTEDQEKAKSMAKARKDLMA